MKIRVLAIIIIISVVIIAGTSVFAQDCSLNGATATDNCTNGSAADDVYIITGSVNNFSTGAGSNTVDMSGGGSVVGGNIGIFSGGGEIVVIGGTITGTNRSGVENTGAGGIINSADINSTQNGLLEYDAGSIINSGTIYVISTYGLVESGDGDIENSSSVTSQNYVAIVEFNAGNLTNNGYANGGRVALAELGDGSIINNGTAEAINGGIEEYDSGDVINNGIVISINTGIREFAAGNVTNNGVVISINGIGINTSDGTQVDIVINNGSVTGATTAIETGGGNDTVINNGTANGNINTGNNNDTVINNGNINGDVNLGDGDDTMHVRNAVNGTMDGGNGTDTLIFELTIIGTRYDLNAAAQAIADANPAGGTVVINGVPYTWTNFESLVELLSLIDVNPQPCASDRRINAFDCHAPVTLYYNNGLEVWGTHPETGNGTYAFTITQAQIDTAGIPESGTVLIAEGTHPDTGLPIALYRHADGAFQVNAFFPDMKPYVGIWQWYGGFTNLSGQQG